MGTLTQFIAKHGITMTAEPTDRNPNMPDSDHMDHWKCTLKGGGKRLTVIFSMGQAHRGKKPEPEEVLNCLASDYTESPFDDWCQEYGYDTDSRKAWRTYKAYIKQSAKLRDFFGEEWLKELFTTERL